MPFITRKRKVLKCVWYAVFGLGLYFFIQICIGSFIPDATQDLPSTSKEADAREFVFEDGTILYNVPLSKSKQKRSVLAISSEERGCRLHRPALQDIMFSHTYWQTLKTKDKTMYLYGAYLDTRKSTHIIKIILMSEKHITKKMQEPQFCRYWANDGSTVYSSIAEVKAVHYLWRKKWGTSGSLHPYLVFCRIPPYKGVNSSTAWESVSLTDSRCKDDISHDLRIRYSPPSPKKKSFGVCIKGLSYPKRDMSRRLIEWMEMNRILGAEGFHFSVFHIHPNVEKVLDHYSKLGLVTKKYTSLPGPQPSTARKAHEYEKENFATWKQEIIHYNDCYFSHLNEYEYITPLDIDEVIIPREVDTWGDLYEKLLQTNRKALLSTPSRTLANSLNPFGAQPLLSLCFKMLVFVNKLDDPMSGFHIHPPDMEYGHSKNNAKEREKALREKPFMMQRVHYINPRSDAVKFQSYKCFHHTGNPEIIAIWNHGPQICSGQSHRQTGQSNQACSLDLDEKLGYVHHHRETCCDNPVNLAAIVHPSYIFFFNDRILFAKEKLQARSREMYDTIFSSAK